MRHLPNLIIAGAPKAGTTSLFWYLAQHPQVCASDVKEVDYFSPLNNPELKLAPIEDYARHFEHHDGQPVLMEASPSYAFGGQPVIDAIKRILGAPRILISLRDPVERFWSFYTFQHSRGRLKGVADCDEFITLCERYRADPRREDVPFGRRRTALSVGCYDEYLEAWLEAFGRDCRVVFAEDLFVDPTAVVTSLCSWLEIDTDAPSEFDFEVRNRTARARIPALGQAAYRAKGLSGRIFRRHPKAREALRTVYFGINTTQNTERLQPETRARLERIHAESNARTARMLRRHGYADLPAWLSSSVDQNA